jgi:hypothetical protein
VRDSLGGAIGADLYGPETVGFRIQTTTEYTLDFVDGLGTDEIRTSSWMGPVSLVGIDAGWVFQPEQRWLFVAGNSSPRSAFLYSSLLEGWIWTGESIYPVVYDLANERYLYFFFLGEGLGTYLFDYESETWQPLGIID